LNGYYQQNINDTKDFFNINVITYNLEQRQHKVEYDIYDCQITVSCDTFFGVICYHMSYDQYLPWHGQFVYQIYNAYNFNLGQLLMFCSYQASDMAGYPM